MDGYNSWKRTEETEIDLADLLRELCTKWKQITVCALALAVILGGYGWMKGRKAEDESLSRIAEEAILTEEEEQSVTDAVRLKNETEELETYLENSLLMQLDPYHKTRYVMLYSIDRVQRQKLQAVTESYLNFLVNGGAAGGLAEYKGWDMNKSYLAEVISAYQKAYTSPYQIAVEDMAGTSQMSESLFYVEITGRDAGEAEKLARDMQDVLEKHSADVKKAAGNHRLKLVSSEESVTADSGLQAQQRDRRAQLSSDKANLKTVTDNFSREQTAAYEEAAGAEDTDEREEAGTGLPDEKVSGPSGENSGFSINYAFLGLAGGIFIYCFVFAFRYLFSDTVKNTEEMKRMYTFPVYGGIQLSGKSGERCRAVMAAGRDAYGQTEEQVLNRIRLACQKQGVAELCAVADFLPDRREKNAWRTWQNGLGDAGSA